MARLLLVLASVNIVAVSLLSRLLFRQFGLIYLSPPRREQVTCATSGTSVRDLARPATDRALGVVVCPGWDHEAEAVVTLIADAVPNVDWRVASGGNGHTAVELSEHLTRRGVALDEGGEATTRLLCPGDAPPNRLAFVIDPGGVVQAAVDLGGATRLSYALVELNAAGSGDRLDLASAEVGVEDAVLGYIEACEQHDPERLSTVLAPHAMLRIGNRLTVSREAICAFYRDEVFADRENGIRPHFGEPVVLGPYAHTTADIVDRTTRRIDTVRLEFTVTDGQIASIEVG